MNIFQRLIISMEVEITEPGIGVIIMFLYWPFFGTFFLAFSNDDDYTTITCTVHTIIIVNGVDSVANRTHKSRLK